jgi:hypothetical protein
MGIQKDSGEILIYIYNRYISQDFEFLTLNDLKDETKWNEGRIINSVMYLNDKNLIKIDGDEGGFIIKRMLPDGIGTVEGGGKFRGLFKGLFGFEVKLNSDGSISFKFSWERK